MTDTKLDAMAACVQRGEALLVLDHALYTPYELDRAVIEFVMTYTEWLSHLTSREQRTLAEDLAVGDARDGADPDDVDNVLHVYGWADAAIDYLNEHHTYGRGSWGHNGYAGVFGCWVDPDTE